MEELFNKEHLSKINSSSYDFFEHPEVKRYVNTIFRTQGRAAVYFLGMGMDPLTTKPEALVTIVVNWKAVVMANADGKLKIGLGSFETDMKQNYEGGQIHFQDATPANLLREARIGRNNKPVLPAGAGCMMLASRPSFLERMLQME